MRFDTKALMSGVCKPRDRSPSWKWAEENINFSKAPLYETQIKGNYDASFMPHWQEVIEALDDPNVKEVWCLKNSRAGCSENVPLNKIRHHVAENPIPILYVSGDQKGVETFMEKRIKEGMKLADSTRKKFAKARVTEHLIYFEDMTVTVTWPSNAMGMKSEGYALIILDEFSIYKKYSKAMYEKRTGNWAHSHIMGLSSIDPNQNRDQDKDPIVLEFMRGDRRERMFPDPETGNLFSFKMGKQGGEGLQWDQEARNPDGSWDLNNLGAHYITPDGTRIDEIERMRIVRGKAKWVPTNPNAEKGVRSYRTTSFLSPFKDGSFDMIVKRFLRAKMSNDPHAMKVFWNEEMAEPFHEKRVSAKDDVIMDRLAMYREREGFTSSPALEEIYKDYAVARFLSIDVQKDHLWLCVREWSAMNGGDSGLMLYQRGETWHEALGLAKDLKVSQIYCDAAYEGRQQEVYEVAARTPGFIPVIGNAKLKDLLYRRDIIDPFEGKRGQGGSSITRFTFRPNPFRQFLVAMMNGETFQNWHVHQGVSLEYQQQVTALECVDGEWRNRRKDEHAFDCEVMQIFGALRSGYFRNAQFEQNTEEKQDVEDNTK